VSDDNEMLWAGIEPVSLEGRRLLRSGEWQESPARNERWYKAPRGIATADERMLARECNQQRERAERLERERDEWRTLTESKATVDERVRDVLNTIRRAERERDAANALLRDAQAHLMRLRFKPSEIGTLRVDIARHLRGETPTGTTTKGER